MGFLYDGIPVYDKKPGRKWTGEIPRWRPEWQGIFNYKGDGSRGIAVNLRSFGNKSFPSFWRRGGQTTKSSDMQNIYCLAGVVDSIFLITFILMDNKHLLNWKSLKPLRSSLRNRSTSAESILWNQWIYSEKSVILNFSVFYPWPPGGKHWNSE